MAATVRYELLRPQEVIAARERAPIAYVPIGPMEWHGPHMAVGMDMLHAHTMAVETAQKAGGVVLPPLPLGTETYTDAEHLQHRGFTGTERIYGMDYPGFVLPSLYIEESALGIILREVIRGLKRQQFKVIALVNGHGALNHRTTLLRVAAETSEPGRATVLLAGYLYDGRYREHAAIGETSYLLAYHPEAIDLATLPPLPEPLHYREFGILDRQTVVGSPSPGFAVAEEHDPRHASADRGRADVAYETDQIARRVTEALAALRDG